MRRFVRTFVDIPQSDDPRWPRLSRPVLSAILSAPNGLDTRGAITAGMAGGLTSTLSAEALAWLNLNSVAKWSDGRWRALRPRAPTAPLQ